VSVRHVIWDWNGTLFDDAWLSVHTVNVLLEEEGRPTLSLEEYSHRFGWPLEDYYQGLGFRTDQESFAELCVRWYAVYRSREHECEIRPEAKGIMEELGRRGLAQSVLSAYQHDPLQELVVRFGLADHLDPVIGLRDGDGLSKVARGREWFESTGLGPHEAVFVGDTLHDVEVAEEIGVEAAGVPVAEDLAAVLEFLAR
jgi:phosphoglycolate phosphatase